MGYLMAHQSHGWFFFLNNFSENKLLVKKRNDWFLATYLFPDIVISFNQLGHLLDSHLRDSLLLLSFFMHSTNFLV